MKISSDELKEALEGLLAKGLVEKITVDGKEKYQLTPLGKQVAAVAIVEPEVDPSSLN